MVLGTIHTRHPLLVRLYEKGLVLDPPARIVHVADRIVDRYAIFKARGFDHWKRGNKECLLELALGTVCALQLLTLTSTSDERSLAPARSQTSRNSNNKSQQGLRPPVLA